MLTPKMIISNWEYVEEFETFLNSTGKSLTVVVYDNFFIVVAGVISQLNLFADGLYNNNNNNNHYY